MKKNSKSNKTNKKESIGTISVCVLVLPGAQVGSVTGEAQTTPLRIKQELDAANTLWQQKVNGKTQGVRFKLEKTTIINQKVNDVDVNTEKIQMKQKALDQYAQLLLALAKKICSKADVFIIYMNGDRLGPIERDGAQTLAITYLDYPLIIMTNGAQVNEYILAHELGHFLFINNRYGKSADPNPMKGDSAHNASSSNLMHYTGIYWPSSPKYPSVSPEQIKKAMETRCLSKK